MEAWVVTRHTRCGSQLGLFSVFTHHLSTFQIKLKTPSFGKESGANWPWWTHPHKRNGYFSSVKENVLHT
jgi:hypothetical protein